MKREDTVLNIIEKIQQDIKDKFNVDYSIDNIFNIVDSQFKHLKPYFKNKQNINFKYLGTLRIKKGREEAINLIKSIKHLDIDTQKQHINEAIRVYREERTAKMLKRKLRRQTDLIFNIITNNDDYANTTNE